MRAEIGWLISALSPRHSDKPGTEQMSNGICRKNGGRQVGKEMSKEWQNQDPNLGLSPSKALALSQNQGREGKRKMGEEQR